MGDLKNWARCQSKFLKLDDGEEIKAQYEGYDEIPNKFDPDKRSIRYKLNVNGERKYWENGTGRVAMQFDNIPEGALVCIKREGLDKKTQYTITTENVNI